MSVILRQVMAHRIPRVRRKVTENTTYSNSQWARSANEFLGVDKVDVAFFFPLPPDSSPLPPYCKTSSGESPLMSPAPSSSHDGYRFFDSWLPG